MTLCKLSWTFLVFSCFCSVHTDHCYSTCNSVHRHINLQVILDGVSPEGSWKRQIQFFVYVELSSTWVIQRFHADWEKSWCQKLAGSQWLQSSTSSVTGTHLNLIYDPVKTVLLRWGKSFWCVCHSNNWAGFSTADLLYATEYEHLGSLCWRNQRDKAFTARQRSSLCSLFLLDHDFIGYSKVEGRQ